MSFLKLSRLLILIFAAGCSTAPAIRYYQIQAASTPVLATASEANAALALGIGPIRLPPYLDRNKIVLAQQKTEIKLAEYSEWAGQLDDNIGSVLALNLGEFLGTERISRYPWPPETKVDYRVEIELIRLHAVTADEVILEARWVIKDSARKPLIEQLSQFNAPITHPDSTKMEDLDDLITAHGEVLRQLALAIAKALRAL